MKRLDIVTVFKLGAEDTLSIRFETMRKGRNDKQISAAKLLSQRFSLSLIGRWIRADVDDMAALRLSHAPLLCVTKACVPSSGRPNCARAGRRGSATSC
eukprot:4250568-Pyramimonas_sp.AAC.1